VPGLLQTERYARQLIANRYPPLEDETIEKRIEGRMERQEALAARKPAVGLCFMLYEAVLRSPFADAEQLTRLLADTRLPNVHIQVLPFERATFPAALMGPMVLLQTRHHERANRSSGRSPATATMKAAPA
jgi:hypothetical protein